MDGTGLAVSIGMPREMTMTGTPSREEVASLARLAGLDLPEAFFAELVSAYGKVRELIDALPHARPRSDEPAHVFVPERFLPDSVPPEAR